MNVSLGVTLPQFSPGAGDLVDGALRAEGAGLDHVWMFDHLWPLSGSKQRPVLECWTSLAHVAAATKRIGVGTLVTRSTLRNAAVLAKMVATVAAIAPDRLTVTIGSGDEMSRAENEAFGIAYFDGDDRTRQLGDTVAFLRAFLRGGGPFAQDTGEVSLPATLAPEKAVPVWIAGRSDAVIAIAADADGWNAWGGTSDAFAADVAKVRAAGATGAITWGGTVVLAETDELARARPAAARPDRIVGGPETVARYLAGFVAAGAEHLICSFPDASDPRSFELLATEVAPRLR